MSLLILPRSVRRQPQRNLRISQKWIRKGLVVVVNPALGAVNQVTRQALTNSGGMGVVSTRGGKSWQGGASKYIDLGAPYDPGTRGITVLQVVNPGATTSIFPFSNRAASANPGIEVLIGNGGVPGCARIRLHNPEVTTPDITGLHDGRDHVLIARYTPGTEIKLWADRFSNSVSNTLSIPASTTSTQNMRLHSRGSSFYTSLSGDFFLFNNPLPDTDVGELLDDFYSVYQESPYRVYLADASTPPPAGGYGFVKVSGSWKTLSGTYVKVAGVWKQGTFSPKVSGSWKALV